MSTSRLKTVALSIGIWLLLSWQATMPSHLAFAMPATVGPDAGNPAPAPARALLDKYCISCHNGRLRTAGLSLERDSVDVDHVGTATDMWEKVLRKVRTQAMPPPGARRPSRDEYAAL